MKKISFLIFIYFFFSHCLISQNQTIPGKLIVQLKPNLTWETIEQELNTQNIYIEDILKISNNSNLWSVEFDPELYNGENIKEKLKALPSIEFVQFDHYLTRRSTIPDDANFILQWSLLNSGVSGLADADVDADEAWDITTGGITLFGDTIVIAIIDDGFELSHPDIHFRKNYNEINNNLFDDDANGYIDDVDGWNAYYHSDSMDAFAHGTHVTGIAGALGNNDIGIAGINWNVQILPIGCDVIESQVVEAYDYAITERKMYDLTNGADGSFIVVTNSSFGIDFANAEDFPVWCSLYDSLGKIGILNAAATINSNYNVDTVGDMPTTCQSDYLIAVANSNKSDELTNSGYGAINIDLSAPGSLIYSTFTGNAYNYLSGTSMSSPHVAGAIALMFAAACPEFLEAYKTNPQDAILLLKQFLLDGVDLIPDLNGISVSGGRLNVNNALLNLKNLYCELSIDETNFDTFINIFPNPAHNYIYIQTEHIDLFPDQINLSITNILGEKIYTESISNIELANKYVSLQSFTSGIYILHISDLNHTLIFSKKIVLEP